MTLDQYLRFGESFGTPIPHVVDQSRLERYPEITTIHNRVQENKKYVDSAAWWHTDQSYEAQPAITTLLYSAQAPEKGGETRFADMVAAYEALSDSIKSRIADLEVEHLYGKGVALQKDDIPTPPLSEAQKQRVPPVIHKLVRPHPVTGQKTLYSPAGTSQGIRGMALAEAKTLLNELAAHALQPRFQNKHHYAVGDVVLWDTAATMHAASPIMQPQGRMTPESSIGSVSEAFLRYFKKNNSEYLRSLGSTPPTVQASMRTFRSIVNYEDYH